MKSKILGGLVILLAAQIVAAATFYRWTDSEGKVHYTDQPPPASAKSIQKKNLGETVVVDGGTLPYELQILTKKFPVTLYSYSCGEICEKATEHLIKRGIPYSTKNPQTKDESEALKKLTGSTEVPVLVVGSSIVKGYEAAQWDQALDAAGYPRNSRLNKPIQPKKIPAVVPKTEAPTKAEPPILTDTVPLADPKSRAPLPGGKY